MCGIFGYKGKLKSAGSVLLNGLKKLEYRGYDSSGMLVMNNKGDTKLAKAVGKVSFLVDKVGDILDAGQEFSMGIAHTRWATHGGVTQANTHPHYSTKEDFYIVHNGIIENFQELKDKLIKEGYKFYSETDTEVIVKLLEKHNTGDLLSTVEKVLPLLEGSYAILVVNTKKPGEMIGVKYGSPLVFGYMDDGEFYFSSDTQALAGLVENVIFLDDGDLVYISDNDYILKSQGKLVVKPVEKIDVDSLQAEKGKFKHYMLKEIYEQAEVMKTFFGGKIDFKNFEVKSFELQELIRKNNFEKIVFVACGTSYHAGWLGKVWFENLANMDADVELASEFEYKNFKVNDETLFVFISQSGETADAIAALKLIQDKGGKTFGIVNVVGSTISRITDTGLFTRAGTEVGVASTKAFISQISAILFMALFFGHKKGLSQSRFQKILKSLKDIPGQINDILENTKDIKKAAKFLAKYKNVFYLGRHYLLPIAHEGSLKLKEISYIHSETYASGELKHGPLALIDEDTPSVLLAPNDFLLDKNMSTYQEVKARKGKLIVISDTDQKADYLIKIPNTREELYPFLITVVEQLLAYYTADILERDIDKPRNLAKSVTVR